MDQKKSHILSAAIYYQGSIYTGKNHAEIGHKMVLDGVCSKPFPGGEAQGFVTNNGIFVGRKVAAQIALAAGQVKVGVANREHPFNGVELFSEDLS